MTHDPSAKDKQLTPRKTGGDGKPAPVEEPPRDPRGRPDAELPSRDEGPKKEAPRPGEEGPDDQD